MAHAGRRPFLRERDGPAAVLQERTADDVLDDARFLIERFLDEERVVGDLEGRLESVCSAARSAGALRAGRRRQCQHDKHDTDHFDEQLRRRARADRERLCLRWRARDTLSATSSRASTESSWPGLSWLLSTNRRNAAS